MTWIMEKALVRANEYGIEGVDYKKTMGVVKNIIPAIASTNALISAACVNECLKLLTGINKRMDNYMQYLGQTRLSVSTLPYQKKDDCLVCARTAHTISVNTNEKVSGLKKRLIDTMQLKNPALTGSKGFLIGAGVFADQVAHKLEMTFGQLLAAQEIVEGEIFSLTDKAIPTVVELKLTIDCEEPMNE